MTVYTARNVGRGATVYDMRSVPPQRIDRVLSVDTGEATVTRHSHRDSYEWLMQTIEFDTIYAFPSDGPPLMFHCY